LRKLKWNDKAMSCFKVKSEMWLGNRQPWKIPSVKSVLSNDYCINLFDIRKKKQSQLFPLGYIFAWKKVIESSFLLSSIDGNISRCFAKKKKSFGQTQVSSSSSKVISCYKEGWIYAWYVHECSIITYVFYLRSTLTLKRDHIQV